ncbi:MAG: glutathione synthase [Robiginitomaculum sp.]|nr:glutathione synthase [Robiginitomaculum sp.]
MTRKLTIATQMDPVQDVDIATDSSFAMLEEAQARGYINYIYQPEHLSYVEGRVLARARKVTVRNKQGDHADIGEEELLDLGKQTDVVLMRQDPPFDMSYITAAHLLELLEGETLVVNDPKWVRSSPEKLFPLLFADLMPPTLISRDEKAIAAFRQQHKDIIIKPLYGNGGAGVFRIKSDDSNYSSLLEMFFAMSREPVMVQAFLPAVAEGDKRIILIDGELAGGFNRIPQKGETRSNMHVGGTAAAIALSEQDLEICRRIGPELKKRGLLFVGIDVIDGYLTEVNVTSPTGVRALESFTGVDAVKLMWNAIESKLGA